MSNIVMESLGFLAAGTTTAPAAGGATGPGGLREMLSQPMVGIMLMIVAFYFIMMRSKRKQDKAKKDQLSLLKRGDRIQTIGGILGTVVEVRDNEVVVKVDEGNNTKIKFARSAIYRVVDEDAKVEAK